MSSFTFSSTQTRDTTGTSPFIYRSVKDDTLVTRSTALPRKIFTSYSGIEPTILCNEIYTPTEEATASSFINYKLMLFKHTTLHVRWNECCMVKQK